MKKNMSKEEFENWKNDWLEKIPHCQDFCCIHEFDSCCVDRLCPCGSIYETYKSQKNLVECAGMDCMDCSLRFECKEVVKRHPDWYHSNVPEAGDL